MAVANHKDPVETILHGGVPIYHLWFLVDLVVMTLVAALAFALPDAVVERVRRRLPESGTVPGVLLALTAVWFACVTVARLTGLAAGVEHLEPVVREALELGTVAGPELLQALSRTSRTLHDESDVARARLDAVTDALVAQLAVDPTRCLAG